MRTDGDGLDLDTLLDMGSVRVVRLLVCQDALAAQSVDKGGPAYGCARVVSNLIVSSKLDLKLKACELVCAILALPGHRTRSQLHAIANCAGNNLQLTSS